MAHLPPWHRPAMLVMAVVAVAAHADAPSVPSRAQQPVGDAAKKHDTVESFFAPPPDRGAKLPPDLIYPDGRRFGFSLYSVGAVSGGLGNAAEADQRIADAMRQVKRDGFTMVGPQYELNHRVVADAGVAGLHCVYTIGDDDRGNAWIDFTHGDSAAFDAADVERRAREQTAAVADNECIAWWNITPEEIRWWRPNEMRYMEAMARGVRAGDPLRRPVMMYEANNRDALALSKTLANEDISGKGLYANYEGQVDTRGPWIRWSIEQEREAIRLANRPDALPIAIPEMFQQPPADQLPLVSKWARHDTYLALICGAKGVVVFSMRRRPGFTAHDAYYEGYASVAREINGAMDLGQVLLFGEVRGDLDMNVTEGPERIVLQDNFGANLGGPRPYPSISFVDIAYGAHRYLLAVNSASEPVTAHVTGLPSGHIEGVNLFANTGVVMDGQSFDVTFEPLQVEAWRFSEAAPDAARAADGSGSDSHGVPAASAATSATTAGAPTTPAGPLSATHRILTWRNAILGGLGAFALLGLSLMAYFLMWSSGFGPVGNLVAQGYSRSATPWCSPPSRQRREGRERLRP